MSHGSDQGRAEANPAMSTVKRATGTIGDKNSLPEAGDHAVSGRGEPSKRRRFGRATLSGEIERWALVGVWAILFVVFSLWRPSEFPTMSNVGTILSSQAPLVMVTLALLVVLIAGDYDLSVAATLTLSSMMLGVMNVNDHISILLCIAASLGMGLVVGFLNGFFVIVFGIDSLIVTIGMQSLLAGIVLWISGALTIGGVSTGLINVVVTDDFLGIPLEFYYGLAICLVMWYFLTFTAYGRRILFVGRGRSVARLSGVSVNHVRWGCFIFAGVLSAFAGIIYTGTTGAADPTSGLTYLLPAFAGCFLGATSIQPGRFNAWGAFVAVCFLATGINAFSILGLGSYVQDLFYGAALIVAVVFSQIARMRAERRQKERDRAARLAGVRERDQEDLSGVLSAGEV